MSLRPVRKIIQPKPNVEGVGVKRQRAFGFGGTQDFDPFLLLDDFRNHTRFSMASASWEIETIIRACGFRGARR